MRLPDLALLPDANAVRRGVRAFTVEEFREDRWTFAIGMSESDAGWDLAATRTPAAATARGDLDAHAARLRAAQMEGATA